MKPNFLKQKIRLNKEFFATDDLLKKACLHTVCQEALCPNRAECFSKNVATFLVLGNVCTRRCRFCQIGSSNQKLMPPDPLEIEKIVQSAKTLGLKHIVITMVTRDDLEDGGANHLSQILKKLHEELPEVSTEVLTSDFQGKVENLQIVLKEKPNIFNHNIETCASLTPHLRSHASYECSLLILEKAKNLSKSLIKSGFMVGLGETDQEVKETLKDLSKSCDLVTIGQYLQPNKNLLSVKEYIPLKKYKEWESFGLSLGIKSVLAGPFVRSSYSSLNQLNEFLKNSKSES